MLGQRESARWYRSLTQQRGCCCPAVDWLVPRRSYRLTQVAAARKQSAAQQQAAAAEMREAREAHEREAAALRRQAQAAGREAEAARQRRVGEMEQLQARFTGLLQRKDETIAALRGQLEEVNETVQ